MSDDLRAIRSFQFIFLKAARNFSIFTIKLKWICAFSSFRTEVSKRTRKLSCVPNHLTGYTSTKSWDWFSLYSQKKFDLFFSSFFLLLYVWLHYFFYFRHLAHTNAEQSCAMCIEHSRSKDNFSNYFRCDGTLFFVHFYNSNKKKPVRWSVIISPVTQYCGSNNQISWQNGYIIARA